MKETSRCTPRVGKTHRDNSGGEQQCSISPEGDETEHADRWCRRNVEPTPQMSGDGAQNGPKETAKLECLSGEHHQVHGSNARDDDRTSTTHDEGIHQTITVPTRTHDASAAGCQSQSSEDAEGPHNRI